MNAGSHSSSELLRALLYGNLRRGTPLNQQDLLFGDYVVRLTPPQAPRMPNGIECRVTASRRSVIVIGRGRLVVGRFDIDPGPDWSPVPVFDSMLSLPAGPEPPQSSLGPWVGDPEAASESMLAGYVAGLVLLHGQRKRAERIALRSAARAAPLGATLLRHAARGEVPEPVHELFCLRDPARLLAYAPSGILWLRGLISAGFPLEPANPLATPGLRKLA